MQKPLSVALATVLLATSAIATGASAEPRHNMRFRDQDRFIQNHCRNNWDNDCRSWDRDRDRWDEARYHRWYRDNNRHRGGPEDAAAAIFGFAAAIAGNALAAGASTSHQAACEARYRSYDWQSNTFMGYDGYRHQCRL